MWASGGAARTRTQGSGGRGTGRDEASPGRGRVDSCHRYSVGLRRSKGPVRAANAAATNRRVGNRRGSVCHGRSTRLSGAISLQSTISLCVDRVDVNVAGAIAALGQDTQRHLQRLHLLSISLSLLALALVVDTAHDESNDEYESTAHADANDQFADTVAFRTAFGLFGRLLLVVVILVLVVVVILVLRRVTSLEPVCRGRGARGPAGCWGWSRRREARVRSRSRASRHWCWCWCWAVFAHGSRS